MSISDYTQQIIHYYNNDYTAQEMSVLIPFSQKTIKKYCDKLIADGTIKPRIKAKNGEITANLVREAYLLGETDYEDLARRFGLKRKTVRTYLAPIKNGRTASPRSKALARELANRSKTNLTITEIAKKHGYSRQHCYYVMEHLDRYI